MRWIIILTALAMAGCASTKKQPSAPITASPSTTSQSSMQAAPDSTKVSCTKDTETRTLEVLKKGPGCVLDYRKFGKAAEVASSSHSLKHCMRSQKKIREKLERSGFMCT